MRIIALVVLFLALWAQPALVSAQTATDQSQAAPVQPVQPAPAAQPAAADQATAPLLSADDTMRSMYITMGAMAGYMAAVMPLTTSAVITAVVAGGFSAWAYDNFLVGSTQ